MSVAVGLLEAAGGSSRGSRIVNLIGGAATFGHGKITDENLQNKIRSHLDIQKERENTKFLKAATKYYSDLAVRAQKAGIVMDLFVSALDQVGVLEMKTVFEQTGGFYVMTDSFGNPVFKESFRKFFEVAEEDGELKMGFLGELKLLASKEIKISGAIGQVTAIKDKTINANQVSDTEIGVGQTNKWYLGGIDRNKSIAFYFDIVNSVVSQQHIKAHIQFQTTYQHSNGTKRLRVTTCQRLMTPGENYRELAYGFD